MKIMILAKAGSLMGHKTIRRLSGNFIGLLGVSCICSCQTAEFEKLDRPYVNFRNTVDKVEFYDLPDVTNWTIISLANFPTIPDSVTHSDDRHSFDLTEHSIEATKSKNSAVMVLSKIPSCEGAGGRIVKAGGQFWTELGDGNRERVISYSPTGVEYLVLQGACSQLVYLDDGTIREVAGISADTIMSNLIPTLNAEHLWDLHGDRLFLLDAQGRQRAEFLRAATSN